MKYPHALEKRGLRMTLVASDENLTRKSINPDDQLKAHPPNPPQWGNEFNNSPPCSNGAAGGGEGAFQFLKANRAKSG